MHVDNRLKERREEVKLEERHVGEGLGLVGGEIGTYLQNELDACIHFSKDIFKCFNFKMVFIEVLCSVCSKVQNIISRAGIL